MADSLSTVPATVDPMKAAYVASLPEIHAVGESTLINITLDVVSIATSMLGALPELRALRGDIEGTWRNFDFERFDKLEQYGLALVHAHGIYNRLSTPKGSVTEKAAELIRIRDRLYAVALPLVEFGLINAAELARCKVALGYRPLVSDITTLVGAFEDNWSALQGKVPVVQDDLVHAKNLAYELMQQLGQKEQAPATVGDAALIRHKVFTLFVNTYEKARRAVVYLRADQGDADDIVPSFYALRAGKKRSQEGATTTPPPASVAPSSPAPVATAAPTPAPFVIHNTAGLPIDNPFTN